MRIVGPVSGDLVVKIALVAVTFGAVFYFASKARAQVADLPRRVGKAAADTVTGTVETAAKTVGNVIVATVDAVPGLTDYLKRISPPVEPVTTVDIGPGVVEIGGQTIPFGY